MEGESNKPGRRVRAMNWVHSRVPTTVRGLALFVPLLLWGLWWAVSGLWYLGSDTRWPEPTTAVTAMISEVKADPAFGNPDASAADKDRLERMKGRALALSIIARMEVELGEGWTPQYLWITPRSTFDNAVNRKKGVLMATTLLQKFFSTTMGKYGNMDPENPWMQQARERDFTYQPDVWGFFERSSVSAYGDGVANVRRYADKLVGLSVGEKGKIDTRAMVNIKASEIYEMLAFVLSKDFIDVPMGWLSEPGEGLSWHELDDRVYFAEGVALVLRDVLTVLRELYPEKVVNSDKGGSENLAAAMDSLDKMCDFDPLLVLRGHGDSMFADHRGKMGRYLFFVRERLADVAETIRR